MIPRVLNFIWIGENLPWTHVLAVRSAAQRGDFTTIRFLHQPTLRRAERWEELCRIPGVVPELLDVEALLEDACARGAELVDVYRSLEQPAGQVNVLRAALLARRGGVYFDLDTVTVGSLRELCETSTCFAGSEHVVLPASLRTRFRPLGLLGALARSVVRDWMRRHPRGHLLFRRVERWYARALNNAVLGATPDHPFLRELLDGMVALAPRRRRIRYALGTTLLQQVAAAYRGQDLTVLPPAVFYPLAPEISEHWFRLRDAARLSQVLRPETRVVHWYASVRTRDQAARIDPAWVRKHSTTQLISALAEPFVT